MSNEINTADLGPTEDNSPKSAQQPSTAVPEKGFTRDTVKKHLVVKVCLPALYGDHHWDFKLRLKLTGEAEDRRQQYLALSAFERTQKWNEQVLDEVCDLLLALPRGFDDLKDNGRGPGSSLREYVETAPEDAKETLYTIIEGASQLYWARSLPQEFRG